MQMLPSFKDVRLECAAAEIFILTWFPGTVISTFSFIQLRDRDFSQIQVTYQEINFCLYRARPYPLHNIPFKRIALSMHDILKILMYHYELMIII